jgi:OmpA-OmpF porin, OOP family
MKKIITSGLLLFAFLVAANAQTDKKAVKDQFQPSWNIGVLTGLNWYLAENNTPFQKGNNFSLTKNASPLASFVLGYDFTPIIGFRGQLGWSRYNWRNIKLQQLNFWGANLTGDLMVNLSNWWGGYDSKRVFDVQAFAGVGAGYRADGSAVFATDLLTPIVRLGLQGNFHVSKQFDINIDVATNAVRDKMNGLATGLFFDDFTSLQFGLTYHFKETAKPAPIPVPEPIIQIKEVVRHDTMYVKVPAPKVTRTITKEFSKEIFYNLDKSKIKDYNQEGTIEETVAFLKANPDAKLTIDAYADKKTGNKKYNLKISNARAKIVVNALKKAGIDENRLTVVAHGDIPQIYKENGKNRVTTLKSSYQVIEVQ